MNETFEDMAMLQYIKKHYPKIYDEAETAMINGGL